MEKAAKVVTVNNVVCGVVAGVGRGENVVGGRIMQIRQALHVRGSSLLYMVLQDRGGGPGIRHVPTCHKVPNALNPP